MASEHKAPTENQTQNNVGLEPAGGASGAQKQNQGKLSTWAVVRMPAQTVVERIPRSIDIFDFQERLPRQGHEHISL